MQDRYIFSVGKPDFGAGSIKRIHRLGYRAGIFIDPKERLDDKALFDLILPFDFSNATNSLQGIPPDLTINGLICTYEKYIPAKSVIGKHAGIPFLPIDSAALCTNKVLMREAFLRYDQSISPQFQPIDSIEDAIRFAKTYGYPVILKPASLVKSLLVMRCNNEGELRKNVELGLHEISSLYEKYGVIGQKPALLVEQFITGQMYTIAGFVNAEGNLQYCDDIVSLTTAQQRHVDDNYLYKRLLPAAIDQRLKQSLVSAAEKGVKALGMRSSPAHIELIVDSSKSVKIIEIGARIGGYRPRMYEMSNGIDLLDAEIKTALNQPIDLNKKRNSYTAVYELFPERRGFVSNTFNKGITDQFTYFSQKTMPGMLAGPAKEGFKAVAIIIISEQNLRAFTTLCSLAESLTVTVE